mmetsp:Transcript_15623/g.24710  ORF Transcript_15623/g.24710 Transcript_15623/m.24710 type:complete len:420 (-) Transcript_15623:215-1474(-)
MASSVVRNPRKIYIANISRHARERDIGKLFEEAGGIASLEHKGNFGFIEYEADQAADVAIRRFHDYDFMGKRLIVKHYRYRGGDFRYNPDAAPNPAKFRGPRSQSFRLYITGLDDSTSWQDVKDFARTGGRSVCYTDVYSRHGKKEGVIEYYRREDFEYALRYLDRARLNGCRVRVFDKQPGGGNDDHSNNNNNSNNNGRNLRGRSRSRSRSRDRGGARNNGNYASNRDRDRRSRSPRDFNTNHRSNNDNGYHSKGRPNDNGNYPKYSSNGNGNGDYADSYRRDRERGREYRDNDNYRRNDYHRDLDDNARRSDRRSPRQRSVSPMPRNNGNDHSDTPPHSQPLGSPLNSNNMHNYHDAHDHTLNHTDNNMPQHIDKGAAPKRDSRSRSPPNYANNGRRPRSLSPINHRRSVSRSKSNH